MLLDIGLGIFIAIATSKVFGQAFDWRLVVASIVLMLLPDTDVLFGFLKGRGLGSFGHEHRNFFHYPIVYVGIGLIFLFLLGLDKKWFFVFAIASFLHFLHDSIGIGWGIQWLWPFSDTYYAFLYLYKMPFRFIYSFTPAKQVDVAKKFGDSNWIKNIYFNFHPIGIVEALVFIVSIIALIIFI